jgi:glycosyltransferase involved in cell wall biosynthesis
MREMKRILHLCETFGTGGAENVMLNVAAGVDQSRFLSTAILFGDGWLTKKLRSQGVETIILETSGSYDFKLLRGLTRTIREKRIDLLHAHLSDANAYACLAGALTGIPVIPTYHGQVDSSPRRLAATSLKLAAVRRFATRVVVVSRYLRDDLVSKANFKPSHIEIIYNGVVFKHIDSGMEPTEKKRQMGFDLSDRLVVMVANLHVDKGYEYFVRAARLMTDQMEHLQFLIIGEGPDHIRTMIEHEIRINNLSNRVHMLGYREDVAEILTVTELFMLSSISEGLSIATIEAMGAGVPVVVTASGGPEEIVTDGETGLIVPTADAQALAEKGLTVLRDSHLANRLALSGQLHVREKFQIGHMIKQYEALYDDLLQKGR